MSSWSCVGKRWLLTCAGCVTPDSRNANDQSAPFVRKENIQSAPFIRQENDQSTHFLRKEIDQPAPYVTNNNHKEKAASLISSKVQPEKEKLLATESLIIACDGETSTRWHFHCV